ncbi:bradyzoite rhoptry protein BRP1 [Toxoplasma gondii ME49]|uniref:Bradyzoite rhoptry protein BRP1 n=4 Tax=Toxoplasma gondii TaxID=5811 RepID=B6K9A1_TOXGV|nr:bradyzoite rhoptry protein BRP1 [Toxoplasma gondii ME49]ESS35196.1 bradyzoite rhoptry protein BRP1 [Toxoplasma gondii VEG]KFG37600.1 bradyzoite rhoptry protein BRP1 [Toxoplasma gondii GAB2-2007-GAL-DOM2]KYF48569.1 bradyzoite rhoptry protein BRP1 [Toxoplasma gondii ARI]EPT25847.1 bradyzoite rhoptry protein BRP1 [Toxoplasma gondii ME49]CEL77652.1 TPA: bradyzoite rhoptry protein BRP1 [Toxoplasma gondii VEG]|eukprot:XP_002364625.1 bradyzoite rhoptry protein BRP1 [Toxoplasma gondii ME49]
MERASAAAATRSPIFASALTKRKPLLLLLGFAVVLTFFTCGVPTTSLRLRGPKFTLQDMKKAIKDAKDGVKGVEDAKKKHQKAEDSAKKASGSKKDKLQKEADEKKETLQSKIKDMKQKCEELRQVKEGTKNNKGLSDKEKKDFSKEGEKADEVLKRCGTVV